MRKPSQNKKDQCRAFGQRQAIRSAGQRSSVGQAAEEASGRSLPGARINLSNIRNLIFLEKKIDKQSHHKEIQCKAFGMLCELPG